jgi:hypothetical protein
VGQHIGVRISEDANPVTSQQAGPLFVAGHLFRIVVSASIQFDREFLDRGIKIQVKASERHLTAELQSGNLPRADEAPERQFSVGRPLP